MTDAQLRKIVVYLEGKGFECITIGNRDNDLFIDVSVEGEVIRLKCKFLESFPYTFPKMYILKEFYKKISPLPHINEKGFICTFDLNNTFPNFLEPEKVVYESVLKSIEILNDGISGANKEDFIDEFSSYWGLGEDYKFDAWALFHPSNIPKHIFFYIYKKDCIIYIHEEKGRLIQYLKYGKNVDIEDREIKDGIYLPLSNYWYPPYPKSDSEIFIKIKDEQEIFKVYYDYLKNRVNKLSLIVFSQKLNDNLILSGFIHRAVSNLDGFRKGKLDPNLQYLSMSKNRDIVRINISKMDRRRLFNRGGDGVVVNGKISVTGCGSIGGYLIQGLTELGIFDLTLIDNEVLSEDNIARHICGASYVGKDKTEAIKSYLLGHLPYIKCESLTKDVFDVFKNLNVFNSCDFNFVVVGNIPIETKFVELIESGEIAKPIILIWVEPYLVGGHAIVIQKPQNVNKLIYDSNYIFSYRVLVNGSDYTKREAGCQNTYIPYSGFEAKQFVYGFLDYFYTTHLSRSTEGNYIFSWGGKLKKARREGMMISDYWLSKEDRTIRIMRLL